MSRCVWNTTELSFRGKNRKGNEWRGADGGRNIRNTYMYIYCVLLPIFVSIMYILPSWGEYNADIAQIGVYLSGAAYCGKDKYMNMTLTGSASGFVVDRVLYDAPTDCEDARCGNQFSLSQTNRADHSHYLGHYLSCETSTLG